MSELLSEQIDITENEGILERDLFENFELVKFNARVVNRSIGEPGVMTIINSKKNGKRIS